MPLDNTASVSCALKAYTTGGSVAAACKAVQDTVQRHTGSLFYQAAALSSSTSCSANCPAGHILRVALFVNDHSLSHTPISPVGAASIRSLFLSAAKHGSATCRFSTTRECCEQPAYSCQSAVAVEALCQLAAFEYG